MLFVQVHRRSQTTRLLLAARAYSSWASGIFSNIARLSLFAVKGDKMGKRNTSVNKDDGSSDEGSTYLEDQITR